MMAKFEAKKKKEKKKEKRESLAVLWGTIELSFHSS